MKKNSFETAYTLIELIVSLMLVTVVVLGIFSISMVLRNNNQDYSQRYLLKSATQITLDHILNDASLAVGTGTNVGSPAVLDQGILTSTNNPNINSKYNFCIHQRLASFVTGPNPSGDIWACYWFDNNPLDTATYQQIWYCYVNYQLNDASNVRGAENICNYGAIPTSYFVGSAYSISNLNGAVSPPSFSPTTGFSITIQNCLNNSAVTCSNTGTSTDPANNPEVQITGSVFPQQVGTG